MPDKLLQQKADTVSLLHLGNTTNSDMVAHGYS